VISAAAPPTSRRLPLSALVLLFAIGTGACGGAAPPPPSSTIFDPSGSPASPAPVDVTSSPEIERPYPSLDGQATDAGRWSGVSVLGGAVRFSRPPRWTIRDAGLEPGHAFVRYVSPSAYSFAIYERPDSPGKSWRELLERYEGEVTANGAKAIGLRIPMATGTNQGRAYTIDRKIESKEPVLSRSREILLRGAHHVVLVQIVSTEENLSRIASELLEILRRLEVD
jgi:hypothetical protein